MKLIRTAVAKLGHWKQEMGPRSLQFRLTLGITAVSLLGVGGMGSWAAWEMRQMLVVNHKQDLEILGAQIPREIATRPAQPIQSRVQQEIDQWSSGNLWVWIKQPNGQLLVQSSSSSHLPQEISQLPLSQLPMAPEVYAMHGYYWVVCSQPLQIRGENLGQLYIARDISHDYQVLTTFVGSLKIATVLSALSVVGLVTLLIQRSLRPLRQMNQLAIGKAPLELDQVPSEVKELVQAFGNLSLRLSETGEQQRQFTNHMSHELRTSLSLVYGYLQSTLRRSSNLNEPQRAALEVAVSETERTIALLTHLLNLARVNNGSIAFNLKPVVLNDVVQEVAAIDNRVKVEAESDLIVATVDREQLLQGLMQLVQNALKYSPLDQPVWISLHSTTDSKVIEVGDRGPGIAPEHQAKLFEPFYRIENSRNRSTGGVGLGLAIVKALVEGMGGRVTLQSIVGEGSVFSVRLPAERGEQPDEYEHSAS
jgi:hypothetical protein